MTHHRHSIRLPAFDYASAGAYFVTICTHQRESLFGGIEGGEMKLNGIGEIIMEEWFKTEEIRKEIILDEFMIMPNHFHGIVWIVDRVGAHGYAPRSVDVSRSDGSIHIPDGGGMGGDGAHNHAPLQRKPRSLSSWVAGFKWATTRRIHLNDNLFGAVWQRNYYEHIIRDERSLFAIRQYIRDNPLNWETDPERK